MIQSEFEAFISDESKIIRGDISWEEDQNHYPSLEFQRDIESEAGYPIFLRGSYNPLTQCLTFALIHRGSGRIYALDMGKDHRNPGGELVGEKHKHRWDELFKDKKAYCPDDITESKSNPVAVWSQFCDEAKIIHEGLMNDLPPPQLELF